MNELTLKRAFLVLAPESHGSHLVTDLLVHAGCHGGSGDHVDWQPETRTLGPGQEQPWEAELPTDQQPWDVAPPTDEDPIVWRRSVPHLGAWLDLDGLVSGLEANGYEVHVVVVTRDLHAAIRSQLKWHHVESAEEARTNIQRALGEIFTQLANRGTPYVVTSYEALTQHPRARLRLVEELGLTPPDDGFRVWDGNQKWYPDAEPTREDGGDRPSGPDGAEATGEPSVDTGFPEAWFPPADYLAQEYRKRLRLGREVMARSRVVFCGLARDIEGVLPSVLARLSLAGEAFTDHRIVVYENDSTDGTVRLLEQHAAEDDRLDVISEVLGLPTWGSTRDPERMAHLAACRNRTLTHALENHGDFDFLIVTDLDLPRGFSYDGLATTFGYQGWDWMGANGIAAPLSAESTTPSLFYDAWAFRWPGSEDVHPFEEVNALQFHRGAPPVPVWSCFGGLAIYRMAALQSGARYSSGECEHVAFHRALRERGFADGFLNPSLIVFYSDQRR